MRLLTPEVPQNSPNVDRRECYNYTQHNLLLVSSPESYLVHDVSLHFFEEAVLKGVTFKYNAFIIEII